MAIVQLQEPYKSFRGRDEVTAGQVLYPSLRRNIARTFVQPANPSTSFQDDIRSLFTVLSQGYSLVTDSQNVGWETLAPNLAHKDLDGNTVVVKAKAAYIAIGFWNTILGNAISPTAPVFATVPGIFGFSVLKRNGADTGWQFTYTWTGANTQIALKATPALPGLRRQPRKNDYRFATNDPTLAIFPVVVAGGTITILDTISRFIYATGDRIALTAQIINDDAIPLQISQFQGIVAAP